MYRVIFSFFGMYVCSLISMYSQHFQQSRDQQGMAVSPALGQKLNRGNDFFLVTFRA